MFYILPRTNRHINTRPVIALNIKVTEKATIKLGFFRQYKNEGDLGRHGK